MPQIVKVVYKNAMTLVSCVERLEATGPDGGFKPAYTAVEAYARLYLQHFGVRLSDRALRSARTLRALLAVERFCEKHDFEVDTWIAAQMIGLKKFLATAKMGNGRPLAFQPNMLLGEKAALRHEIHVRVAQRRYHRSESDTSRGKTMWAVLSRVLFQDEYAVASYYVGRYMLNKAVQWEDAARLHCCDPVWLCLQPTLRKGPLIQTYAELVVQYDKAVVSFAQQLATLKAACAIADRFAPRLSDRLESRGGFCWDTFARFLRKSYGHRNKEQIVGPVVESQVWTPGKST